jgi:O-antigen/teichoic acid export membrane protein
MTAATAPPEPPRPTHASEAARGAVRIAANYTRLTVNLALAILLVPLQLAWLGKDAFGLLALLSSSIGLASIVQEVVERSMIRELGAAYHAADPARFRRVYNAAYILSAAAAVLFFILWMVVLALLPYFQIKPELLAPARWLTLAEGLYLFIMVLLSPTLIMYVVAERFVAYNAWQILQRSSYIVPAVLLYYVFPIRDDRPHALTLYALGTAVMNATCVILPALTLALSDRRFRPAPWRADRSAIREIVGTFGWNSCVVVAISSPERVCTIIGNLAFPISFALFWNAVFGLSVRAVAYVRIAVAGMTDGLDAVTARIGSSEDRSSRMARLVHHATRLHAFVALPAGVTMFLMAEPLLKLWIGRAVREPERTIPPAIGMVRMLVFALAARAISDGWIRILYGTGLIRRVAPLIMIGALLTPVFAVTLLATLSTDARVNAPAIAVTAASLLIHLVALPPLAARCLGLRLRDLLGPILRPALSAAIASPVYLFMLRSDVPWTLPRLLVALAAFGAAYAVVSSVVTLTRDDRRRLIAFFAGRLGRIPVGGREPQDSLPPAPPTDL